MGTTAVGRHHLSRFRKQLIVWLGSVLIALLQVGCGSMLRWGSEHASGVTVEEGETAHYIVNPGDTLYSIAFQVGQDYHALAQWNGIRWPYRIYPDQRLLISPPPSESRRSSVVMSRPQSTSGKSTTNGLRPKPRARTRPATAATDNGTLMWQWPTEGTIIKTFSHSDPGRKGLDIVGRHGQPVRAAAPGRVVYSGSGLRGYGQLIIVKHNSVYLSAYGHNKRLLVKEGETIHAGQLIAEMGDSEATQPMLHFEIRRNGEPIDPQRLLPRR